MNTSSQTKTSFKKISPKITSKTVATAIVQKKASNNLSKVEIESLIDRFKTINKTRESFEKVEILDALKNKASMNIDTIAKKLKVSKPQVYNLVRAGKIIRKQPAIAKYIKEYGLSITDLINISRNKKNAESILKAVVSFVNRINQGIDSTILAIPNKKKPVLAIKSSFSQEESKQMRKQLNRIFREHKKSGTVSQYQLRQIATYAEHVLSA